jgi:hypothetical protein
MARKFYYCPMPKDGQDPILRQIRKKFVRSRTNGPHAIEVVYNRGGLQYMMPGDTLYLNAHGSPNDPRLVGSHEGVDLSPSDVANRLIQDGLPDGTLYDPLLIKCLMCYAGGHLPQENHVTGRLFEPGQTTTRYTGNRQFLDVPAQQTVHLADGYFAQKLARRLGRRNRRYVLVGGYPGAINAARGRVCSGYYRVHCTWFDCWGNALVRRPRAERMQGGDHEFEYAGDNIVGQPGWG